uniref:asparagine synthase (glutamine-hydrolyzing) n=1 Tax=Psychrobacter sp. (strain PRwf-1) TaxID=349106 RepID=A5WC05_PSYWF
MCGLTGFMKGTSFSPEMPFRILKKMTDSIDHRGPDSEGHWIDEDNKIAIGHRRLSILDLSDAGHQPMLSDDNRYVIAFNGELYNHLEIRSEIESKFSEIYWNGHSDTETLLKSIEVFGWEGTLKKLIGMFAITLWDKKEKALYLARDRFGEKPLYYGWQGDTFLFGSELKPLTLHPVFEKELNKGTIGLLLKHGYIPAPYSIWNNIFKLPAAHYLIITEEDTNPKPICYWSFKDLVEKANSNKLEIDDNKAIKNLEDILTQSIKRQMISDVPLGALLSGGIDSSLVAALMQDISDTPIKTFSIGFEDPNFDESKHAEAVADYLGTDHTTLIMKPDDLLDLVPEIAKIYDEPFADSSQLPTTIVSRLAKQHVTVALSGDAGDETFGGYSRYYLIQKLWKSLDKLPHPLRNKLSTLLTTVTPEQSNLLLGWLFSRVNQESLADKLYKLGERLENVDSFESLYLAYVSEINNPTQLIKGLNSLPQYLLGNIDEWPELNHPIEKLMALDTLTYLTDDILVKVDRAAMSASLELRAPFLDHNLVEYAWQLPFEFKYRDGQTKWILRQVLYKHVPKELIERPKQGFGIPLNDWLRGPLKDWAEKLLSVQFLEEQNIFYTDEIRDMWRHHLSGTRHYGARLWSILMFQAWYKENFYNLEIN